MKNRLLQCFLCVAAVSAAGCQSNRVFYTPEAVSLSSATPGVILAADFGQTQETPTEAKPPAVPKEDAAEDKSTEADGDGEAQQKPVEAPQTQPYTAPRAQFQGLIGLFLGLSSFGFSDLDSAGKELAEAGAMTSIVGRPGLAAPQPTAVNAVVGRQGLQTGFPSSLGFGSPDRNIFTPRFNPASGAGGRCQELVSAGFFGSRTACERQFSR